ncbi:MAG: RNA polymerase sigma-G factor [Firmicutes bacterium HGW-Firmicutes-13]|nr:MAG: RNA polymerase sigma-G factor [Firmicutes bacterium HGW-Firmicutes-13]
MNFNYEEMENLLKKAKEGDIPSREKVIEINFPLIETLVKRFSFAREDKEDLFQVGCIGLLKAVDNFELDRQVKFSTYAFPVITGEIRMYLRKNRAFKVSRVLNSKYKEIKIKKEEFIKNRGREPSIGELARELNISREEIVMAEEIGQKPLSLEELPFLEKNKSYPFEIQEPEEDLVLNKITLKEILTSLEGRERQVIFLRFFEEKTQKEVAQELGISQVHVSRLERNILNRLRENFKTQV